MCRPFRVVRNREEKWHSRAIHFYRLQQGLQDKGYEEWVGEMIGVREILKHFANISRNDIVGMRAPFLKPGRNTQFAVSIINTILVIYA